MKQKQTRFFFIFLNHRFYFFNKLEMAFDQFLVVDWLMMKEMKHQILINNHKLENNKELFVDDHNLF